MAGNKGRGGPRRQMKGFRPGKEPAHLKKKRAKAELGSDAGWVQKQAVDAVAGRSPAEVEAMVRKWSTGLFAVGALLAVLGFVLYGVALWAGAVAHVLAVVVLFLGYRMRKQGPGLVEVAKSLN